MTPESLFKRLSLALSPKEDVQKRIKMAIQAKIQAPAVLENLRDRLSEGALAEEVKMRILSQINPSSTLSLLDRLRGFLKPSEAVSLQVKQRVMNRLAPPVRSSFEHPLRWVSAFAVVVFVMRASPLLFIAPQSIAESPVTLLPLQGQVSVLVGGLWQPVTEEVALTKSALIQTQEGSATIISHDDYVMRLSPHTTVAIHDLSDRPGTPTHDPTVTLHDGNIWVQAFVPTYVQDGISIATTHGTAIINEGSASLNEENGIVDISVWNRRISVSRTESKLPLLAGERLRLWEGNVPRTEKIEISQYDDQAVTANLKKDAVHQREIAHLQQERRAAAAGILPTSRFYSVKRAAEAADMLFTFGEEERTKKLIEQAKTRLNEAAALISEGSDDEAKEPLKEFQETLLSVATGTGNSIAHDLVERELVSANADVAAALPDDDLYALKEAVLTATIAVSGSTLLTAANVEEVRVTDALSDLKQKVGEGKGEEAKEALSDLQPYLSSINDDTSSLSDDLKKEVEASLAVVAATLTTEDETKDGTAVAEELLEEVESYLPEEPVVEEVPVPLSDEEIAMRVRGMSFRIFRYNQPRPQWNQLQQEFKSIDGHPDQGRILRRLEQELRGTAMERYIDPEIQQLKDQQDQN